MIARYSALNSCFRKSIYGFQGLNSTEIAFDWTIFTFCQAFISTFLVGIVDGTGVQALNSTRNILDWTTFIFVRTIPTPHLMRGIAADICNWIGPATVTLQIPEE